MVSYDRRCSKCKGRKSVLSLRSINPDGFRKRLLRKDNSRRLKCGEQ